MMDWLGFWLPLVSVLVIIMTIASLMTLVADGRSEGEEEEQCKN